MHNKLFFLGKKSLPLKKKKRFYKVGIVLFFHFFFGLVMCYESQI